LNSIYCITKREHFQCLLSKTKIAQDLSFPVHFFILVSEVSDNGRCNITLHDIVTIDEKMFQ